MTLWKRFGALARLNGITAIHFLLTYVILDSKSVGADLLGFAAPKIAEVVSETTKSKQLQRVWQDKL